MKNLLNNDKKSFEQFVTCDGDGGTSKYSRLIISPFSTLHNNKVPNLPANTLNLFYSSDHHNYIFSNDQDFLGSVHFQTQTDGHVRNGLYLEDLLKIIEHRLMYFQKGECSCMENELALSYVTGAIDCLNQRTKNRLTRGVWGTTKR